MIRGPTQKDLREVFPLVSEGWRNFTEGGEAVQFTFSSEQIVGNVPLQLRGTFLRNGPGYNVVYGTQLAHPIDGDGLVAALTFPGDGKVHFNAKFVQTKSHREEAAAKKMLYNGAMGSRAPEPKSRANRDPAHTNVFYWGGKILALHEYALPHRLSPADLSTLGPDSFDKELELNALSAHYRYDAIQDHLVVIAFRAENPLAKKKNFLSIYEYDRANTLKKAVKSISIPGLNYAHDFAITPNWYIFHISPFVDVSEETLKEVAAGRIAPGQTMRYCQNLPSQFCFISRATTSPSVVRIDVEPFHIYHFANCREDANGTITFGACCLPPGFTMEWQNRVFLSNGGDAPGVMHTIVANPKRGTLTCKKTPGLETTSCEFPTTNPYRHCVPIPSLNKPNPKSGSVSTRYTYLMGGRPSIALPFCDVVKHDSVTNEVTRWHSGGTVGEPCFVPRLGRASARYGAEDDGFVIVQVYHYEKSDPEKTKMEFCILDAQKLAQGPICRLKMPFHIPYGFHGTFCEEVVGNANLTSVGAGTARL